MDDDSTGRPVIEIWAPPPYGEEECVVIFADSFCMPYIQASGGVRADGSSKNADREGVREGVPVGVLDLVEERACGPSDVCGIRGVNVSSSDNSFGRVVSPKSPTRGDGAVVAECVKDVAICFAPFG